jgi:hypothetical protein
MAYKSEYGMAAYALAVGRQQRAAFRSLRLTLQLA